MDRLFLDQIQFEKKSMHRLSDDSSQWVSDVVTYFQENYPELSHLPARIEFTQKDDEAGVAVGSLHIGNLALPVIIKNYILSPLNVAIINGVAVPFTPDTVSTLFQQKSAFSGLKKPDSDFKFDRVFQRQNSDIEAIEKYASVLDNLSGYVTEESISKFSNYLQNNPIIAQNIENKGYGSLLEKISNLKTSKTSVTEELVSQMLSRDIYLLEKTGKYEYKAILGNSQVDDRLEIDIHQDQLHLINDMLEKTANLAVHETPEAIDTSDLYFMQVMDYDGSNTSDYMLTTSNGDHKFIKSAEFDQYADYIPATEIQINNVPQKGEYGCIQHGNSATRPFFVEKVAMVNGELTIDAYTGRDLIKYQVIRGIDQIIADDREKNAYFLPQSVTFLPMSKEIEGFFIEKEKVASKHSVFCTDNDRYTFVGHEFNKYANLGHNIADVDAQTAKWIMLQNGVSKAEVNSIELAPGQRHSFLSKVAAPISLKEQTSRVQSDVSELFLEINDEWLDLNKEASIIEDESTVDSLLSLNFLNKSNLQEFIMNIPAFEQVLSSLAKLLLTVRLGESTIPEIAVERAMEHLTKVTAKLYELAAIIKNTSKRKNK